MIYFVTYGRGFEQFVKEELEKISVVRYIRLLAEGKLLCILCSCKENDICNRCQLFSKELQHEQTCLYQNLQLEQDVDYRQEIDSLLKLKLIERVYLLLLYKKIHSAEDEMKSANVLDLIEKLDISGSSEISELLNTCRSNKESEWRMCVDPETCPASCVRKETKKHIWKRRNQSSFGLGVKRLKVEGSEEKLCINNETNVSCYSYEDQNIKTKLHPEFLVSPLESCTNGESTLKSKQTYRVSCRIRGIWKKHFKPNVLSQKISTLLFEKGLGKWMNTEPDLDIYVNLNDELIIAGVSLSRKPLSLRPYMPHITLRSSVCHIMVQLSEVCHGETLLDPMCGTGTILLEAVMSKKNLQIIASDVDISQLRAAQCNLRDVGQAQYVMANAERMPLRAECVDAIVCDFPFGRKHFTENNWKVCIIRVLQQMVRVVKNGGKIVLLISERQKKFLNTLVNEGNRLEKLIFLASYPIALGLSQAFLFVYQKMS